MQSRSNKALINAAVTLIEQIVTIVCGFILPRLILVYFGSAYNGLTSSITQFISCITLLRAGVGGVTRASLYKPLMENDIQKVSAIVRATEIFMRKVAVVFIALLLIFASVYPYFVRESFGWLFSFSLIIIISLGTLAQYFFGITYQMLLQANQKNYITAVMQIAGVILNTIIAVILIKAGCGIHIVKLGSALVFTIQPIVLNWYVTKKYGLNKKIVPDNVAINQRWDAFMHQVAAFVHSNTDLIVLTIFSNVYEISVYTVYYMVIIGLRKLMTTLTVGIDAAFGNMIALKQTTVLSHNVRRFEFIIYTISTIIYTCTAVLIVPFVLVYTSGINDVSYYRPTFAYIVVVSEMFYCFRMPYQTVVEAEGQFKQTRNGAIFEALLNIIISVVLVNFYGLIGVAIGTLCAMIFRTIQYAIYASKNILHRSAFVFTKHMLISCMSIILSVMFIKVIPSVVVSSYFTWIIEAIIVTIITTIVNILISYIFYKNEFMDCTCKLTSMFSHV